MRCPVSVRWNGRIFNDVEVDPSESASHLKAHLSSLTEVPAARQKIMGFKGGALKDDTVLSSVGLHEVNPCTGRLVQEWLP